MKYLKLAIWTLASLLMVQCSEEGEKEYPTTPRPNWVPVSEDFLAGAPGDWKIPETGTVQSPAWGLDVQGSAEAPQWTAPNPNVYPTSMTAVIRLTPFLEQYLTDEDQMAAFIGDECRGVADIVDVDGISLFFIMVKAQDNETGNVTFRYYNKKTKNLFSSVAADVAYEVNKIYGTVDEPAFPDFEQSAKYPIYMNAALSIDLGKLPFETQEGDELAAFVENDCRGRATLQSEADGKQIYTMEIRGKEVGETIEFKYYSAAKKSTYRAEVKTTMEETGNYGSSDSPVELTFVPEYSMTAYVRLDDTLIPYASSDDQLAAFNGSACCGVGEVVAENENVRTYKLVVTGTEGSADKIDVKYYNAVTSYLYTASSYLTFATEAVQGSAEQPEVVPLNQEGKHPLKMNLVLTLPEEQAQHASTTDLMAAFVGNECRAVATGKLKDETVIFELTVNGSISNNEKIQIKYYAANTSYLYASTKTIDFEHGSSYGTETSPMTCPLVVSE